MGSYISSFWQPRRPETRPPFEKPMRPSPRLSWYTTYYGKVGTTLYEIEADTAPTTNAFTDFVPMLFIETTCLAVVDYCLLGRRSELSGEQRTLNLDPQSPEYKEVCLRLRRCGAANVVPLSGFKEADCPATLENHLYELPYLFGWPEKEERGELQPVVVYRIPHTPGVRPSGGGGMEWQLLLPWLVECQTMAEYCQRLRDHGAADYDDVRNSPEALEMGLV